MKVRSLHRGTVVRLVVECGGVLDAENAAAVKRAAAMRIDGSADLLIDLSQVEFIDSMGLGVLVALYKRARASGRRASFVGVRPGVRRVMEIIRLHEIFDLQPDLQPTT